MEKGNHIEIHETGFVTSTFRSLNEHLSKDPYAKLWHNKKTELWLKDYLEQVSTEETATHCLRNRYFLAKIEESVNDKNIEVIINFGAGFSMYPFLLDEKIIHIEIDKPEITKYKEATIKKWQKTKVLPKRNVYFIGVDFSTKYQQKLLLKINSIKENKNCFILIEGVLFFLDRKETDHLFDFFSSIQKKGDIIGSASFQDELKEAIAFKRLLKFIGPKDSKAIENDYQTIPDEYYKKRIGYKLIDHQDYYSLSKRYKHKIELEKEFILNENFYLLEKVVPN